MKRARHHRQEREPVRGIDELAEILATALLRMRSSPTSTVLAQNSPTSRVELVAESPLSVPQTARLTADDEENYE